MDRRLGLYTICYAPGMAANVEPACLAFDVSTTPHAEQREIAHMLTFWREGHHRNHAASGLLSPKFSQKTRLSGASFVEFVESNPGYDVWFINPFPHLHYLSFNMWEQGDFWHPGLIERAQKLYSVAGVDVDLAGIPRSNPASLLFCNFWMGTPRFWDRFMTHAEALVSASENVPELYQKTSHYDPAGYFPFAFERLFTTFLHMNQDIKACPWRYSLEETLQRCSSEMEYVIVHEWAAMIDHWDAGGVYDASQRHIFRTLQVFCNCYQAMKREFQGHRD